MSVGARVLAVLIVLAPLAALAQQAANPPTVQVPTLDDEGIEAWSEKLDQYATVHVDTIRAWTNVLRYMSSFNFRTGPTGNERSVYELIGLDAERVAAAAKLARELAKADPPIPEVDRAAEAFASAVERMPAIFNEAAAYYGSSGLYKADRLARGKILHPAIMAAIEPYLQTHRPFLFQVNQARRALNRQEFAMLERRGDIGLRWHMRRLLETGFDAAVHIPTGPRGNVDIAAFERATGAFGEQVMAFQTYRESEQGKQATEGVSSIDLDRPEGYLRDLRRLAEAYRMRDRVPLQWELLVLPSQSEYHRFWGATLAPIQHARDTYRPPAVAMKSLPVPTISIPDLEPRELRQWRQKAEGYFKLLVETSAGITAWNTYQDWVRDPRKGPTGREKNIRGLSNIDRRKFATAIAEARRLMERDPAVPALDDLAKTYAADTEALAPVVSEAEAYYQRRDYLSDGLAGGRAFHPKLMEVFEPFRASREALSETIKQMRAALDVQQIAQTEKREGRSKNWHRERILLAGRQVRDALPPGRGADLGDFDAAVSRYVEVLKEFDSAVSSGAFEGGELATYVRRYLGNLRDFRENYTKKDRPAALIDSSIDDLKLQYSLLTGMADR
jgi:Protein of unknown function (DUF3829)